MDGRLQGLGDDEEECAHCGNRHAPHNDNDGADMQWIGCENEDCGKWYHQVCVGISEEEYSKIMNENKDWFCTPACETSHHNGAGERSVNNNDRAI